MPNNLKARGTIFYGWIIIITVFIIVIIAMAIRPSFSLFYVAILEEFGWSRAGTAIITSVAGLVYGICAPLSGFIFDRFGPRRVFPIAAALIAIGAIGCSRANEIWQFSLFYGVIVAMGIVLIGFIPIVTLASNWFTKRRALAVGFSTAGIQGAMLFSPLIQSLISSTGWRNAYIFIGIAVPIIIVPLSMLLRAHPQDMQLLPDGSTETHPKLPSEPEQKKNSDINRTFTSIDWTLREAMKTYQFWSFLVMLFVLAISRTILLTHQVAHMVDIGFSPAFSANILVLFAIASICGRFGGFISDRIGREIAYTIGTIGIFLGILMFVLANDVSDVWMIYAYAIIYGVFLGINTPTFAASVADLFHGRHFGSILGFIDIGFGLGATLGPWLGGYLFDLTSSYVPAFITAIGTTCLGCVSLWIASPRNARATTMKKYPKTTSY